MPGAVLEGLKVLDLSWGIAGPMATMLLADHGAAVTRIEPPGGDPFRTQLGYRTWQRGKRSAVLDLKTPADRDCLLALAHGADILVESFAPGVTARLGIDYARLHDVNPRLIYCSITAYGRGNRHSERPGYDALVAARTGLHFEQRGWPEGALNHMARRPDPFAHLEHDPAQVQGPARSGPVFPASFYPSLGAFFAATLGIHAALHARAITGRGQWVETSLLQGALACASGVWQRAENLDARDFDSWILGARSPKGHFQCADGRWIHNWVPNPRFLLSASAGDDPSGQCRLRRVAWRSRHSRSQNCSARQSPCSLWQLIERWLSAQALYLREELPGVSLIRASIDRQRASAAERCQELASRRRVLLDLDDARVTCTLRSAGVDCAYPVVGKLVLWCANLCSHRETAGGQEQRQEEDNQWRAIEFTQRVPSQAPYGTPIDSLEDVRRH
jgi:crotonobetainyl-CoA:carnitine CoA-transferase CaiB-like acyl-CoA transferase